MPSKIILDCDPGHDDAIAILLAHGSPEIELVAVTTVAGNQTLEKVTRNAIAVARVGGIAGVPFAAGCARPLLRTLGVAGDIDWPWDYPGPRELLHRLPSGGWNHRMILRWAVARAGVE